MGYTSWGYNWTNTFNASVKHSFAQLYLAGITFLNEMLQL